MKKIFKAYIIEKVTDAVHSAKMTAHASFEAGQNFGKRGSGSTTYIVGGLVVAVLLGALAPTIFSSFNGMKSDGNLSTSEKALIGVLPVFFILGLVYYFVNQSGAKV